MTLLKAVHFVPEGSRLTFVRRIDKQTGLYLCRCGGEKAAHISNVQKGATKSCGCISKERHSHTVHGLRGHPLYNKWMGMKARCYNKRHPKYPQYGGRGVKVCIEWLHDFRVFYDWAIANGWKPGLQIDKDIKGNGKLYSPQTCVFVTNKKNCNRRTSTRLITLDGITKSMQEWCEFYGLNYRTFTSRINTGWSVEKAMVTPKQFSNKKILNRL